MSIVLPILLSSMVCSDAFYASRSVVSHRFQTTMHFEESVVGNTALSYDAMKRERYVAINRFTVREGADAKFDKRWAERKSRLATLPGFRFFSLLRRIDGLGTDYNNDDKNYLSMTVWEDKDSFDAWRTGDAFKEAHGGGGIGDFIKLLSTALFILKGSPKPAFYDGLVPIAGQPVSDLYGDGGWRSIAADGVNLVQPDVFVSNNRFNIPTGKEIAFERSWKSLNALKEVPGFLFFSLMRRDASKADDGFNYVAMTVWTDNAAYDTWRATQPSLLEGVEYTPKLALYEGKLALMSKAGA